MDRDMLSRSKDSVWIGLGIGIVVPGVLVSGVLYLMHTYAFLAKADLLLVGCVAINALLMHYCHRQNKDLIGRGVISATFLWAFAFYFYKIYQ